MNLNFLMWPPRSGGHQGEGGKSGEPGVESILQSDFGFARIFSAVDSDAGPAKEKPAASLLDNSERVSISLLGLEK